MKKKILYVWTSRYPWEIRIKKITQSLVSAGFDTYVLAKYDDEENDIDIVDNGVKVIRFGKELGNLVLPVPFNPLWKLAINTTIKKLKPDLIIVREILLGSMTAKLGRKYNIPVIMDMAENYPACMKEWKKYNSNFIKRFFIHTLRSADITERRSVKLCDGIMVVCDEQIERLNAMYNYNKDNICVIENTPEDAFLSKVIYSETDLKYKLENNIPIVFGHHGNLSGVTSLENFLYAFEELSSKYNLKFIIAGTGEHKVYVHCKNIIKDFKSKDNIYFTGKYNYNDLPTMLKDIDIGVTPYQAFEFNNYTLYNKTYFYMAAGRPILTNLFNPHIRLFNETGAGLALDFTSIDSAIESIEKMIHSDTISMSKNGRKAVLEKYNWNTDANKMIRFINGFLK